MDSLPPTAAPSLADVRPEAFPARTTTATGTVGGITTSAMMVVFSDKIVVTIIQDGMGISQWVEVPAGLINSLGAGGDLLACTSLDAIEEFESDQEDEEEGEHKSSAKHGELTLPNTSPLALLPSIMNIPMAKTILGGGDFNRDLSAHFISRQIAAIIDAPNDTRSRSLVVGFGWRDKKGIDIGPDGLETRQDLMDIILQVTTI